jgi:hypothetical protein
MSPLLTLRSLSAKVSSWQDSSILATILPVSARIPYGQVAQWPFDLMMLVKTSSRNWVDGQAPLGLLTFMLKSLLSPQVCQSAWSSTMCSTMFAFNSSVPLTAGYYGFPGMLRMELPNTLTRCRSWRTYYPSIPAQTFATTDRRYSGGATQCGHPGRARTLVRGETKAL